MICLFRLSAEEIEETKKNLGRLASLGNDLDPLEYYPNGTERYLRVKEIAKDALRWMERLNDYPRSIHLRIYNFAREQVNVYFPNG